MGTETQEPTLLDKLHEQRTQAFEAWEQHVTAREAERSAFEQRMADEDESKRPNEEQREAFKAAEASFRAKADQLEAALHELDKRIDDQNEIVRRRAEAAEASARGQVHITREPMTYERYKTTGEDGISYFRDLAAAFVEGATFRATSKDQALSRLERHRQEMDVEMPKRRQAAAKRALEKFEIAEGRGLRRALPYNPFEKRIEPNRTDGEGGYFVPPLWLIDQFIPGLRAHLVAAALCRQLDLPAGTDSINIPKLANLTAVGYQQADTGGVVSQDWSDTAVQANVKTIAGQTDMAIQLLEQSPNHIVDEVVTMDLEAAFNAFLDLQVLAGDGLNTGTLMGGHLQGIYNGSGGSAWSNANSITYTDGSPSGQHFVSVLGAMASQISRTRFDASNFKVVLHGRRWFWYSTSLDVNGRPLGETPGGGRFNVAAAEDHGLSAEGLVGTLPFLADAPVYIDDNVPTTDTTGGGSGQDVAIAALWDDAWLFRGEQHMNVYREVLSGSLGVRFQVYEYDAFLVRYGQSLAVAAGTGFAAPTGSVSSIVF